MLKDLSWVEEIYGLHIIQLNFKLAAIQNMNDAITISDEWNPVTIIIRLEQWTCLAKRVVKGDFWAFMNGGLHYWSWNYQLVIIK